MDEIPLEAPPDDVVDQRAEVTAGAVEDDYVPTGPAEMPWDADPADVAEQQAEVPRADDDWA